MMTASVMKPAIAPRWRKNRRRTICPWESPSTSLSSMAFSTVSVRTEPPCGLLGPPSPIGVVIDRLLSRPSAGSRVWSSASGHPDPWVEDGVQQVGDEVRHDGEDAHD